MSCLRKRIAKIEITVEHHLQFQIVPTIFDVTKHNPVLLLKEPVQQDQRKILG